MAQNFSCPNCAEKLTAPTAACVRCGYPNHRRDLQPLPDPNPSSTRKPFQFRIRSILFLMIITAILARVFRSYGWTGIGQLLDLCAIFSFPLEFARQFWKNLSEPLPGQNNSKTIHPLD